MNTRTKSVLIYIGGIVTGIILTFVILLFVAKSNSDNPSNDNMIIFEQPQQKIDAKSFEVMQVLPDGNALATVESNESFGMIVMLLANKNATYYDNQKIEVPTGKCARQIGTYRYMTRNNIEKTVPIIDIVNE
mgnify:FL=1